MVQTLCSLFASYAVFVFSVSIIIGNYHTMRKRELEQSIKLSMAEIKATTDQLTGVKNRHAYAKKVNELDDRIAEKSIESFAIVICDINNLKTINDNYGHNEGDKCICKTCELICHTFKHSHVYRLGGDEFTIILENDDYNNRNELIETLQEQCQDTKKTIGASFAIGMSEFIKESDESVLKVFTRADEIMYITKNKMKMNHLT